MGPGPPATPGFFFPRVFLFPGSPGKNDAARYGGYALIALGVLLYVVYGLIRGAPTDVGVYSITIVPVVFGIAIAWLTSEPVPGEN